MREINLQLRDKVWRTTIDQVSNQVVNDAWEHIANETTDKVYRQVAPVRGLSLEQVRKTYLERLISCLNGES